MSLPPIPDEAAAMSLPAWHDLPEDAHDAVEAAMDAAGVTYGPNTADYYIAAAWPHLYATALRHAADRWDAMREADDQETPWLREWADEATP